MLARGTRDTPDLASFFPATEDSRKFSARIGAMPTSTVSLYLIGRDHMKRCHVFDLVSFALKQRSL